jgi:hypothetical protein
MFHDLTARSLITYTIRGEISKQITLRIYQMQWNAVSGSLCCRTKRASDELRIGFCIVVKLALKYMVDCDRNFMGKLGLPPRG